MTNISFELETRIKDIIVVRMSKQDDLTIVCWTARASKFHLEICHNDFVKRINNDQSIRHAIYLIDRTGITDKIYLT